MPDKSARILSSGELAWVRKNHPTLIVHEEGRLLRGTLHFNAYYEYRNKQLPVLEDEYEVEMRFNPGLFPHVREIGGRLQKKADKMGKPLMDMHVYPISGEICMGTAATMTKIINDDNSIQGVFHNLIIRYFYYHSFWEKFGDEPWPGLVHGLLGLYQDYLDNKEMGISAYLSQYPGLVGAVRKKIIRGNDPCPCNPRKAKSCKSCNCGAVKGLKAMQKDYRAMQKRREHFGG